MEKTIVHSQGTYPEWLYHYTSLESLALILQNRTIKFNSLQNVDDLEEAATEDMGEFGKYVYASCWTDSDRESIALWKLYTPDMHGIRLGLPPFPFRKHVYKAGQFFLSEDISTYINLERLYGENRGSIILHQPDLVEIEYTDDPKRLFPHIRETSKEIVQRFLQAKTMEDAAGTSIGYSFPTLGKCKRTDWSFQKEWRYLIFISPTGLQEMYPSTFEKQQDQIKKIEDPETALPYDSYFLELDDSIVSQMKILTGPKMTEAEKIYLKSLLRDHGLLGNYCESQLRIRQ